MKVVVVGGSASGAAFAARARRLDEKAQIVIIEKTDHPSFATCGMPYFLGEEIKQRSSLLVTPMKLLTDVYNFDIRIKQELVKIIPKEKKIVVKDMEKNTEYTEEYDKLVLAMGSKTFYPPIPGIKGKHVYPLQNLYDMDKIFARIKSINSVLILGAGMIGVECAEQMKKLGKDVHLVEIAPHIIPLLDEEMAKPLEKELVKNKINVYTSTGIKNFKYNEKDDVIDIDMEKTVDGKVTKQSLSVGIVIVGTGVRANSEVAKTAGIKCNSRNVVVVDENLKTSDPNIYALGDMCTTFNTLIKQESYTPLANVANIQGRTAANHCFNSKAPQKYKGTIATGFVKVFDYSVSAIGMSEFGLKRMNIPFKKFYTLANHRPLYMPLGCEKFNATVKVLYNDEGNILGVQTVGKKGVETLGMTISMALTSGLNLFDLEKAELPYCPYFGEARSTISMIGMIGAGLIRGTHELYTIEEATAKDSGLTLIDIRPPPVFNAGHFPGSINLPLGALRKKMKEGALDKKKKYATVCNIGKKAYWAYKIMKDNGYDAKFVTGSWLLYSRHYQ